MLNLPSTTRVNQRIPKEAFYRHLDLTAKQKAEFVQVIDRITVVNSLKPATANIVAGKSAAEILVLELNLKEQLIPKTAIELIAKQNPHQLLFACTFDESTVYAIYRANQVWITNWYACDSEDDALVIAGNNLDEIWENLCGQLIFGLSHIDVDSELSRNKQIANLDAEISKLKRAHGRESQVAKRNALFKQLKETKRARAALGEGLPWRS